MLKHEKCVGLYIWLLDMWYLKYTFKWLNHSFIPSISKTCRWHQGRHVGWSSKRISGDTAIWGPSWMSCASSISHQPGVFIICLLCSTMGHGPSSWLPGGKSRKVGAGLAPRPYARGLQAILCPFPCWRVEIKFPRKAVAHAESYSSRRRRQVPRLLTLKWPGGTGAI